MQTIYLDYASTTPLDERVLQAMMPHFKENYGNSGSVHHKGQQAKLAVEEARETIAKIINADPSEIVFTSGGTESNNAALKSILQSSGHKNKIISSKIEHKAILQPLDSIKKRGYEVVYAKSNENGVISVHSVAELIDSKTALVSIMHLNNELGTINKIKKIAEICTANEIVFHTDAVQSFGKLPIDVKHLGVDLMSASAHKFSGPKGVGLLYMKSDTPWSSLIQGGSQERNRRGGTLNVPGIVGMAKALEIATKELEENQTHSIKLRGLLLKLLNERLINKYHINGDVENGIPHILNISFYNNDFTVDGKMLLLNLDMAGICVSNGSACSSGAMEPSHVLKGLGLEDDIANSSIRISFGKETTSAEIIYFVDKLVEITNRMFKK